MNRLRIAHLRYVFGAIIALVSIMALPQTNRVSGSYADRLASDVSAPVAPTPVPPDKNSYPPPELDPGDDFFSMLTPDPLSKNGSARPVIENASGETWSAPPDPGSRNDNERMSSTLSSNLAAVLAAGGSLLTCGASGNTNWTTTSSTFQVIRQCTLTVPQAGWVFISTNGSVTRQNGEYEALFEIGIDTTGGDATIDRWVSIYNDSGDGTDKSVALSVLKSVTAGTHTFYFLGKRYGGSGTVLVYDPTLTVIFIPATNSQVLACGASGNTNWTTTSSTFQVIRQCTLTVPQAGWVFISTDGSVARQDGEYEALFEIGIDTTGGDATIDRWVNIYDDSGDGTDKSVALSVLKSVTAGTHTFYFLGKRYGGSGTMLVYDSTLTVIFIPAAYPQAVACGASGNTNWTTTSSTFQVIRQCTLTVPQAGWVFISTNGSVARQDGEYEALFEIGIDTTGGDATIDRWVNIYDDSGDGTDESVALSVLKSVTAGTHTFYFLGKRYGGSGTMLVYDPTLTVIAPGAQIHLPLVMKGQ